MTYRETPLPATAVVGGCGHVGLPFALALAGRGVPTVAFDLDARAVSSVMAGRMPFDERGADDLLGRTLAEGTFRASTDPAVVAEAEVVVVVVGTPVDEHLNPDPEVVPRAVGELSAHLRDGQLLVLRSTVYPGVTRLVEKLVAGLGRDIDVTFCPERIAEGQALTELYELPQIVCSRSPRGVERASALFRLLTDKVVVVSPEEGELAKLFTNTWRYLKFAAANQLYMIANDYGLDFERIRAAITEGYPRRVRDSPLDRACSRTPCSWRPSTTTTSRSATPAWR
jgi:UDP-N-acetyl-D-mannosaminuronic acid dehydrogenase